MTRVLYDLQQQVFNDYVHTNIAGATVENHTADPDIVIETVQERTPTTYNTNGRIVFVDAEPANSIENGPSRNKIWFASGYIQRTNTTIFDEATIMAMHAEVESVFNVYNNTIATYTYTFVSSKGWNTDPITPIYDFVVEVVQYGVTART